jgi:hypothetical protein
MSTPQPTYDRRRFRLATNDNEIIVSDDEQDVEAHRLATNDNEVVVDGLRRLDADEDAEDDLTVGMRRARR